MAPEKVCQILLSLAIIIRVRQVNLNPLLQYDIKEFLSLPVYFLQLFVLNVYYLIFAFFLF